jgi:hypothetical protein
MNTAKGAVITVTAYLIIYVTLINVGFPLNILPYLYIILPFLFCWMIYCILKDTQFEYPELGDNEEWGYCDKAKEDLGTF